MENRQPLTSPDGSRNTPERCPCPLYSRDFSQGHQEIPQENQDENLIKIEVKEDLVVPNLKVDDPCKEEEIPPKISTDPKDTQNDVRAEEVEGHVKIKEENTSLKISTDGTNTGCAPEGCQCPFYSQYSTQEHEVPCHQEDTLNNPKVEVKEESEDPYRRGHKLCGEEKIPPEISTGVGTTSILKRGDLS